MDHLSKTSAELAGPFVSEITALRAQVEAVQSAKDGMSDREKLIREGFCFDSDRDCETARYLIGVIDVIRWDRSLLRAQVEAAEEMALVLMVRNCSDCNDGTLLCDSLLFDLDREDERQECPNCRPVFEALSRWEKAKGKA